MMRRDPRMILAATLAGLCLGCAQTQPARLYVLSAADPAAIDAPPHPPLEGKRIAVARLKAPKYLDRLPIVTRANEVELAYSEFHRWAEPLPESLERVLSLNLASLLPGSSVVSESARHHRATDYVVSVEILGAGGALGTEATLSARWSVSAVDPHRLLLTEVSRHRLPLDAETHGAYVEAMNRLVLSLARDVAEGLRTAVETQPPAKESP